SVPIASRAMTPGIGRLFGFLNFQYFASLIVAALRACAMRHLAFVAIRALGKRDATQGIVRAPGSSAALGVPPFWIGHWESSRESYQFSPISSQLNQIFWFY